jgi:DNA-3-methyladenine glycosylase
MDQDSLSRTRRKLIASSSSQETPPGRPLPEFGRSAQTGHGEPAMSNIRRLRRSFFDRSVHEVAPELIGATLIFDGAGGIIVEVEAYHHTDPAAHSFRGRTDRNAVMFGPAGHAYIYRSYGIHWCLNFVCEPAGSASAVLIRALAPTCGHEHMQRRRGVTDPRLLCSGPGRLCEALGITGAHNGLALTRPPFRLLMRADEIPLAVGPRIGISKAADHPWRYGLAGSRFLSKPFRPSRP